MAVADDRVVHLDLDGRRAFAGRAYVGDQPLPIERDSVVDHQEVLAVVPIEHDLRWFGAEGDVDGVPGQVADEIGFGTDRDYL
ncbi:hypothetical protein GCM10009742_03440 [Kribbella karoonensis]|uniref:Uncharacterized protein n=1 Tax=Kribbella karoonensis TaxID=324851 RepID=A0ABN2CVX7_9ACTN